MNDSKSALESKIILTNGVAAVAAIAMALGVDLGLDPASQAQLVAGFMVAINVITIVLRRWFSTRGIVG